MSTLIIIIGLIALFMGVFILMNPESIFGFLRKHVSDLSIHIIAVASRLLIGSVLIYYANASKYPFVIETIGWLAIIAGLFLLFVGRGIFVRMMNWAVSLSVSLKRLAGVFAACFGTFLIIAFT